MNQNCQKCQAVNPMTASYCQNCGSTLGATVMQGRTVVAPLPSTPVPDKLVNTAVQRAQQAFGNAPITTGMNQMTRSRLNQREQTGFVTDKSGSMSARYDGRLRKIEAASRAGITMVLNKYRIDPNDEVGIVTFESNAQVILGLCPLHSHKTQIIQALQSIRSGGGTDINEGLKAARDMFDWSRNDVVRRIVLLTDGHGGHPIRTAEDLKSRGVVIEVIGVGDCPSNVDEKLLKKVASVIEGELRYWFIKDQKTLFETFTQLSNKTATCA